MRSERQSARVPQTSPPPPDASRDDSIPWQGDLDAGLSARKVVASLTYAAPDAAKPVNPDDAIVERTRVAAGGCFSSLSANAAGAPLARSAHLVLTVIPTGTVSRADVSSGDTTDTQVLDCIQARGQSTVFSDNDGGPLRTYAIDVQVFAPGAGSGR